MIRLRRTLRVMRTAALALLAALAVACGDKEPPAFNPPAEARQTLLMYLPWSGNLTDFFRQNIADMEQIVARELPSDVRVLVYFMEEPAAATLFEIYRSGNRAKRKIRKRYNKAPDFTTAEGISGILDDVRRTAPARSYAMAIGSHGMAWLPAKETSATHVGSLAGRQRQREYWEVTENGKPLTRWFGGTSAQHRTDIATLAEGIARAGMHMDYILFDNCYMSSIEVAYDLRHAADYLIASPAEIMAYGFPYARMGGMLFGTPDLRGICDAFHDFYIRYEIDGQPYPYGTIAVTDCAEVEALADLMARINAAHAPLNESRLDGLQVFDGYSPARFFDLGDYVRLLCTDDELLSRFEAQLARTVPYGRHTGAYYTAAWGSFPITVFSGITCSDPSINASTETAKTRTAWWQRTH